MIKKRYRFFCILLILCVMSVTAVLSAGAVGTLPEKNTAVRHQPCTGLSEDALAYYTGEYSYERLSALSGASDSSSSYTAMQDNELFGALYTLMSSTHTYSCTYSGYNSGSLAYFWDSTDSAAGSDSYVMFYTDIPSGEGVKLNREHIWPKSRASFHTKNGGADLHHLRPSIESVNMAKSDHLFGEVDKTSSGITVGEVNGQTMYYVDKSADLFECKDDVKGDVSRILLYVYCRWQQPNLYTSMTENLPPLDPDDQLNNGLMVIESLDTLLDWCESDPVDSWEMARNDRVEEVQGNRNVFIDYPELAWRLFGREVPEDMVTPRRAVEAGLLCGDTDGDGEVTVLDATAVQRHLAELPTLAYHEIAADADGDGEVTILDATAIQRHIADLPTNGIIGQPITARRKITS